jgi:16S rRNA (adenine1518-N6/adenine1519-N6)-dimethyltransferase
MGALTLELLHLGARVTAVDVDLALARQLPKTVASHTDSEICGLTVLARDVFELRPSDVPKGPSIAFVSLPRDVTTDGVLHVLTEFPSLRTIVAVVESMVDHWENSTPGSPGYDVAVARLRYLADMRHDGPLPASAFWPLPPRAPDLIRLDRLD